MEQQKTFSQFFDKSMGKIIAFLALIAAIFHIYIAFSTSISMVQQRVFHVFVMIMLYYLSKSQGFLGKKKIWAIITGVLFVVATAGLVYYLTNTTSTKMLQRGMFGASNIDIYVGVVLILMILDIARKTIGWALAGLSIIFIFFAMAGPIMPDIIAHKGYDIPYITNFLSWTTESIFGIPVGASVSFVALYVIFGELLEKFGAGKFFIDIAYALTGRVKGGPAEAAVVSSALMGSINGSAVANVVTTGTFTIPLMKKVGYKSEFAGAVEAVASTGGQLLPPVMGAAAFVMADITGFAYSSIIIAALIPGLLFYLSLGISVFLEAGKLGIEAEPKDKLPNFFKVLKEGWYYGIPIIVLIVALLGYSLSANYSALFAIASLLIIAIIKELLTNKRFPLKEIYQAFVKASKTMIPVTIACACAGIVIGIVGMTGIGVKFTRIVFELSGGNVFMMLSMIMVACIIMGMGLPSTAAYIIAATIGVPTLIQAGIPPLAANMFVFYFAIMSFITPPVAISAYAASGIANSNANKTGYKAFALGLPGFIIPFVYAYKPDLLIIGGSFGSVITIALLTAFAIALVAIAVSGWLKVKINIFIRILLFGCAILLFVTGTVLNIIGLVCGIGLITTILLSGNKYKKEVA